jgi:uncharacterized membrane protein (UPF0127 family)
LLWPLAVVGLLALALVVGLAQRPGQRAVREASTASAGPAVEISTRGGQRVSVQVEVADTAEARAQGLMYRETLAEDRGMLFIFEQDVDSPFWMANTLLPLSIAFVDARGTIVDIKDMQPLDTTLVYAKAPYRFALEVNQGCFAVWGVAPGDRVVMRNN